VDKQMIIKIKAITTLDPINFHCMDKTDIYYLKKYPFSWETHTGLERNRPWP